MTELTGKRALVTGSKSGIGFAIAKRLVQAGAEIILHARSDSAEVEEAKVKATHEKDWLVLPASGEQVEFETAIFFPWDSKAKRFKGERVYFNFDRKFYKKYGMEPPFPELEE